MSDQTTTMFDDTSTEGHTQELANTNLLEDLLKEVVNERGEQKYKSVEDALKGVKHSQEFIQTLTHEKKTLEQQYEEVLKENERLKSMEEFVLNQKNTKKEDNKVHSPEEISAMVAAELSKREAEQSKTKNLNTVAEALKQAHGERAKEVFVETAQKMGMTVEALEGIAATSPQAAISLLGEAVQGANKQPKTIAPGQTVRNTAADSVTPTETYLKKPETSIMYMSDHNTLLQELDNSKKMLEELESMGKTIKDLSDPTEYFKYFK